MPYHHFTSIERDRLQIGRAARIPLRDIADELQKYISALYREFSRHRQEGGIFLVRYKR
jgi:IS30 family transposase